MSRLPPGSYKPLPSYVKKIDADLHRTERHVAAEWHVQSNGQLEYMPQKLPSDCDTVLVRARKRRPSPDNEDAARAAEDGVAYFKIHAEYLPDPDVRLSKWHGAVGASAPLHALTGQTIRHEPDDKPSVHKTLQDELTAALAIADQNGEELPDERQRRGGHISNEHPSASSISTLDPNDACEVMASQTSAKERDHEAGPSKHQYPNTGNMEQLTPQLAIQTYKCPACCSLMHVDSAGTTIREPPRAIPKSPPGKEKKHKSVSRTIMPFWHPAPAPQPACMSDASRHLWMPIHDTMTAVGMQQLRDQALVKSHMAEAEYERQCALSKQRYYDRVAPMTGVEKTTGPARIDTARSRRVQWLI